MTVTTLENAVGLPVAADLPAAYYELHCEDWLPRSLDEVFPFFADAYNLERITPEFLRFKVLGTSQAEICRGTLIDYRLHLHGVPFGWRTIIDAWEPGVRFVDRQLRGPFKLWHHTHEFEEKNGGTIIRDRVRFDVPLGPLGRFVAGALVRRDVEEIFRYRQAKTREIFRVDSAPHLSF